MITLKDYITASGKYPNRESSAELTELVIQNASQLIIQINRLLKDLGVKEVKVSSGFRPLAANAAAGGAKKSNHMLGLACDLSDPDGKLDELFMKNLNLLAKHGLYLESPDKTVGWSHLQTKPTKNIVFLP